MRPEEISRQYSALIHNLCADITDPILLKKIWETSDDYFRTLALSIWKSIGIAPSAACAETYALLHLDRNPSPAVPSLAQLHEMISAAPTLQELTPPYLGELITLDLKALSGQELSSDDRFTLENLLAQLGESSDTHSPASLTFVTNCSTLAQGLAAVLQDPCPVSAFSQIENYWEKFYTFCQNMGVQVTPEHELELLIHSMNRLTEEDVERTIRLVRGEESPEEEETRTLLNTRNKTAMAREAAEQAADRTPTLEELLAQLHGLCGMERVKNEVQNQIARTRMQKLRRERGKHVDPSTLHMAFLGNPGTGKTTVARLIGQLYHAIGVLPQGQLVEVDRSGLVAEYIGHTERKTQTAINRAIGGVLFVDEAYALASRGDNDFGQEAIEVILKNMEDHREDLLVIVAGYPDKMKQFLHSNPGLESRFKTIVPFDDYTGPELLEIFCSFCEKGEYILTPQAWEHARSYFEQMYAGRGPNFGNARDVRNFFDYVQDAKARREFTLPPEACNDEITGEDILAAVTKMTAGSRFVERHI
ncbi:hypothetical protein B5G06_08440 [Flavonifractor sp. An52]|uniref:AAA family ATPase n=1 Tax=Flavonifractor sp. An52 TaxID=1965642 RepID=UPI000B394340|nr:AAA family ATPase [Flavonifractor sp. An52]OUN83040.1 hypothetical protein B5G06_08440 [Flavonifractor sp. An52]